MMRGAIFALLLLLGTSSVSAEQEVILTGTHEGADYLLHKPTDWKGGLVLFAHGYGGEGEGRGEIADGYLRPHLEAGQIAFATTGYRAKAYRPDWFLGDIVAVRALFIEKFGMPRWTILYGDSMGGHVVVAGLESHPELFQGGMAECGVVDGVGIIDWHYAYTAAAEYFSGVPLLDASPAEFERAKQRVVAAMGKPGAWTERGRRFDNVVRHLAGGDLPLWEEGLAENYLNDLRARRPGPKYAQELARHADTRGIVYGIAPALGVDAATLNRDIRRVVPEAGARTSAIPAFAPFTGRIRVPLVSLHTTGDTDVPFRLEQDYRRRTIAAGTDKLLVQRTQRRSKHCAFDASFREEAFDDLVKWIARGVVPKGENVLGDVSKLGEP